MIPSSNIVEVNGNEYRYHGSLYYIESFGGVYIISKNTKWAFVIKKDSMGWAVIDSTNTIYRSVLKIDGTPPNVARMTVAEKCELIMKMEKFYNAFEEMMDETRIKLSDLFGKI